MATNTKTRDTLDCATLRTLLCNRFCYSPTFEPYAGIFAVYNYSLAGVVLLAKIIIQWRKHFVYHNRTLSYSTCT